MSKKIWNPRQFVIAQYDAGTTGSQIAKALGITKTVVSSWRHGREPSPEQVKALAKLLRAKPDDFFVEVDCEK